MTKQYKCYSNREENRWRIVTLLKPSTVPTFWHVKDVETNEVFHAAWDMIEEVKEQANDRSQRRDEPLLASKLKTTGDGSSRSLD